MSLKKHIKDHFFLYALVVAVLLTVTASYSRFLVKNDYIVFYEGECDPAEHSCFIGCNDDECTEEYFYSKVEKNAHDIYAQCGDSVLDCAASNSCLPSDTSCSIQYCDEMRDNEPCSHAVEIQENVLQEQTQNQDNLSL